MAHQRKISRIVPALLKWYAANARDLPWRRTRDPYAIWVSEVMLQQTQVKTVLPYWERWMKAMPNVRTLAKARSQTLHKLWEGLGYYTRVRNMRKAARVILQKHQGKFPQDFEDVLGLPGIGRYTAGAICSIALNQPQPIVDGNVARVLTRVFGINGDPRERAVKEKLWGLAQELVECAKTDSIRAAALASNRPRIPKGVRPKAQGCEERATVGNGSSQFNQSLMELGALVCTPRSPKCDICPVLKQCSAFREDRVEDLPALARRERETQRRFVAVAVERKGRFFVRQRPEGIVNGHLWEFPNAEAEPGSAAAREAKQMLGGNGTIVEAFCTIKHSITRYRITMDVFRAKGRWTGEWGQTNGRWLTMDQLRRLPFASAHRKVLERLVAQKKGKTRILKTGK